MSEPVSTISAVMLALFAQIGADDRAANCVLPEDVAPVHAAQQVIYHKAEVTPRKQWFAFGEDYACALVQLDLDSDGAPITGSAQTVRSYPKGLIDEEAVSAASNLKALPDQQEQWRVMYLFEAKPRAEWNVNPARPETRGMEGVTLTMRHLFDEIGKDARASACIADGHVSALRRSYRLATQTVQAYYPRTPIWSGYAYQCALVSFQVSSDGTVAETTSRIVTSFPVGKLDRSALKALRKFRFKPPQDTEATYLWLFDVDLEKD